MKFNDRFVIVEVSLRDDGSVQLKRVGTVYSERMAFNTALDLNAHAYTSAKVFYQIEFQRGLDSDEAF